MRALWLCLVLLSPGFALGQEGPAERARAAIALIDEATAELEAAGSGRDRVQALTRTIVAYEDGLAALRSGLREASARQSVLEAKLLTRDEEIAALLQALQRVGGTASPVLHLHPGGPLGTLRAGMLIADVTPALNARAADLRRDLEALEALRSLQQQTAAELQDALNALQAARAELNTALANRTEVPQRFRSDPVREAILITSVETLADFAAGLDELAASEFDETSLQIDAQKGSLPLPVRGTLLHAAGEPDAAGVVRPGVLWAARPEALVVSPAAATLRYVGPLLDFGTVIILEPQVDVLFIFAGLGAVYGATGDLVSAGDPLGVMGGKAEKSAAGMSTDGDGAGTGGAETLYIEVRQNNIPQDPSLWFDMNENG